MVKEKFNQKKDLLKLVSVNGKNQLDLTDTKSEAFSADSKHMAYVAQSRNLVLVNLTSLRKDTIPGVSAYQWSNTGAMVVFLQNSQLLIMEMDGTVRETFENVEQYRWHPKKSLLVFNTKIQESNALYQYDPVKKKLTGPQKDLMGKIEFLGWDTHDRLCAVSSSKESVGILSFYMEGVKTAILNDSMVANIAPGFRISDRKVEVDTVNHRVFFYRERISPSFTEETKHETWYSADPWIQPKMEQYRKYKLDALLSVWHPLTGKIIEIETIDFPHSALGINHSHALIYNPLDYEPLYKQYPNADIYVKDLKTGAMAVVCKDQYTAQQYIQISPSGKYVTYFSNNHWYLYEVSTGTTKCLTSSIQSTFVEMEFDRSGDPIPYGQAGWTNDEAYVMVYDKYDIWLISPITLQHFKITHGLKDRLTHRMDVQLRKLPSHAYLNRGHLSRAFKPKKSHLVRVNDQDLNRWGFGIWQVGKLMSGPLAMEETKIEPLALCKGSTALVKKERYNAPPSFHVVDTRSKKQKLVYQSNRALLDYDLGEAKIVEYSVNDSVVLRGALMYPANFDRNQSYPMMVHIYEKELKNINQFIAPSAYNVDGFNRLKLLTEGYLVFYPNINYIEGEPGISALRCVESAVKKVLEEDYVDKERVGLIGHSFGGYETAYIASRSKLFAMAVMGAGIFDLYSHYHDITWDDKSPKLWRFENQQYRFGSSFYERKKAYFDNSPSNFVEGIDIPILIWSGKEDTVVNWNQSMYMFMAMKRLQKNAKLILFEKEGHYLMDRSNQKKLYDEIQKWIGKH